MSETKSGDYVLGTHDEELQRLGVQHRAWRDVVLECWNNAVIATGARVLDVGAGPGYATDDLAKLVGAKGRIVAVERSPQFLSAIRRTIKDQSLSNVEVHELDLMTGAMPAGGFDFVWC